MNCSICGRHVSEGLILRRINEYGVKGVWACEGCLPKGALPADAVLDPVLDVFRRAGADGGERRG